MDRMDDHRSKRRLAYAAAVLFAWTALILFLIAYEEIEHRDQVLTILRNEARISFQKDLLYRRWNADLRGVYAEVSGKLRPNSLLGSVPGRDVRTLDGKRLTLINPSYMTRLVHEMEHANSEVRSHLTSLRPLRAQNAPDPWERLSLLSLGKGVEEVSSVELVGGRRYLRLMRPLHIEPSCLGCHGRQGYRVGDVSGGISVSIPVPAVSAMFAGSDGERLRIFGTAWLGGILLITVGSRRILRSTELLETSERKYRALIDSAPFGIYLIDGRGCVEYRNEAMIDMTNDGRALPTGADIFGLEPYCTEELADRIRGGLKGSSFRLEGIRYLPGSGGNTAIWNVVGVPFEERGKKKLLLIVEDVTKRFEAEEQQRSLQEQLLQAQKIESLGRLAGGVAHDFNNILSAIIGYSDLALMKVAETSTVANDLRQIKMSGERAASVAQQLLAFSRKQVLEMNVVGVNDLIRGLVRMLERLIGEDVSLVLDLEESLPNIQADPHQVEQVLINLAVNARDAMPRGGKIVIATSSVNFSESDVRERNELIPGRYVSLVVTDSGTGMTKEVQDRIFEPFYTTKERGKGTGLGLSTVYGVVKQHRGYIYVTSRLGEGAVFSLYFPATSEMTRAVREDQPIALPRGTAAVLVVEDDASVRQFTTETLSMLGYRVTSCSSGREALAVLEQRGPAFDAMLTDVVMPSMNGKELADYARSAHPHLRIAFMSGYTDDVIGRHGVLEEGIAYIQKPLTPRILAFKMQEILHQAHQHADP